MTSTFDGRVQGRWIILARVTWIILTLVLLSIFVAGLGPRFEELTTICDDAHCLPLTLTPQDAQVLRDIGLTLEFYGAYHVALEVLGAVTLSVLAALLFWRRFDDRMSVIVSFALVLFGLNSLVEADIALIKLTPALLPWFHLLTAFAIVPFALLFYLFPNGRFVPGWTRFVGLPLVFVALFDPLLRAAGLTIPSGQVNQLFLIVSLVSLVIGVYAQVYRYRRVSGPIERQQSKWVVFGLLALSIAILTWLYFAEIAPPPPGRARMAFNLPIYSALVLVTVFFPVSIAISILRYRLWDIDIVIRRTLIYSILTGLLALVYFGSVVILQSLFSAIGGGRSELVIVLSTLTIAALFLPLRRRLQNAIDRRFYRRKYNAVKTLAEFGQTARDETDLDRLTARLIEVVHETMQPVQVSLWLKDFNAKTQRSKDAKEI